MISDKGKARAEKLWSIVNIHYYYYRKFFFKEFKL